MLIVSISRMSLEKAFLASNLPPLVIVGLKRALSSG